MICSSFEVDHAFGAGKRAHAFGTPVDRCATAELERAAGIEIDEQHSGVRIDGQIAQRVEHAVAVVVGECDPARIDYPHEARIAALVRDVGAALGIVGRDEESVGARNLLLLRR